MQTREWAPDSGAASILYLKRRPLVNPVDRIERGGLRAGGTHRSGTPGEQLGRPRER